MKMPTLPSTIRKFVPDVLAGLAVFALILALTSASSTVSAASGASLFGTRGGHHAIILLAGGFSAMVALNVAFFRHLCRAYAAPRRAAWRRAVRSGATKRP